MLRIDRYILSLLMNLFGFFALVLVAVYWINQAVRLFEQLLSDGQTALVVLEFTLLTLPYVIAIVLPVAAFAASAYGTNRLSGESELTAMQAAGLSPWRLARPVLVFGLIVSVMVAVLLNGLVPMARARLADRQAEVAENVTARFLRGGVFQYPAPGVTLFIRQIADTGELNDVFLEEARDPGVEITYTARRALIVRADAGPKLIMIDGMRQEMVTDANGPRLSVTRFEDLTYDIASMIGSSGRKGRDLREYGTPALLRGDPQMLEATGATAPQAMAEAHARLSQPLLAPVGAMLGFAMLLIGGYSRFGVWRQVAAAIVALIAVQLMSNAAAQQVAAAPGRWPLLYIAPLSGAVIAALALWWAARGPGRRKKDRQAPSGPDRQGATA
ncbi:LPS export ABC transporter permease LptF [Paracoccus pacificus]|uniref:LPS export ABC transporter permease LptF n=1 Tax=Paracoccus pacificus TaxID=1463598 RepID=A0ABW4R824_9RHOB